MKIISLRAENIKKLVAVEIKPDGNMVEITGRNGQGKTSVLDSIWWALGGLGNVQTAPIRAGQEEGRILLDLGEIRVVRTFRQGTDDQGRPTKVTSSINVVNADGSKFGSPQAMLDGLVGALSFDPLAFSRMDPGAQFKTLSTFVPGVDFDAIDRENKIDYDKRTEANRRARDARTLAEKITVPVDGPVAAVDDSALIDELEKSASTNADITTRKNNRDKMAADAMKFRQEAARLVDEATKIEARLAGAAALPPLVDVAALRQKIAEAQEINADVSRRAEKRRHLEEAKSFQATADTLTKNMEAREGRKRTAVESAELPVPGLGFGAGFITLAGVPLNQASDAEQLRVSIAIAMAANPKLRVIRVRDGSLLDEDSMALLGQMAKDRDFQVWVERVSSDGKVGFVLEDGHVKTKEAAAI